MRWTFLSPFFYLLGHYIIVIKKELTNWLEINTIYIKYSLQNMEHKSDDKNK